MSLSRSIESDETANSTHPSRIRVDKALHSYVGLSNVIDASEDVLAFENEERCGCHRMNGRLLRRVDCRSDRSERNVAKRKSLLDFEAGDASTKRGEGLVGLLGRDVRVGLTGSTDAVPSNLQATHQSCHNKQTSAFP